MCEQKEKEIKAPIWRLNGWKKENVPEKVLNDPRLQAYLKTQRKINAIFLMLAFIAGMIEGMMLMQSIGGCR